MPIQTKAEAAIQEDPNKAFFDSLPSKNLAPLWTELAKLVPPFPNPKTTVGVWKYAEARPLLMQAGDVVEAEEAERRVLMLINPGAGE
jgi:gentisate 1,2-dioxygenase